MTLIDILNTLFSIPLGVAVVLTTALATVGQLVSGKERIGNGWVLVIALFMTLVTIQTADYANDTAFIMFQKISVQAIATICACVLFNIFLGKQFIGKLRKYGGSKLEVLNVMKKKDEPKDGQP